MAQPRSRAADPAYVNAPARPAGPDSATGLSDRQRAQVVRALLRPGGIRSVAQPIVRLSDGVVVGYEALARSVDHPSIPPDVWLAMAEAGGQRVEAELACLSAAAMCGAPPDGARLFVNVSEALMLDPRTPGVIRTLPPHVLEVTENDRIDDYAPLVSTLQTWTATGSLLAVDDVGAGYANMAHVLRLTPSFIKIDRSLVCGLQVDRHKRALVSALVAFARQVGATCIGEGVETAEELDSLRALGVELVQGYLVARPGLGWPAPADVVVHPGELSESATADTLEKMAGQLAAATSQFDAAEAVTRYLFETCGLLPSVYLHHARTLRCLSRRGQWLVLDGMPADVGITGITYAQGSEIYLADVALDARYRSAIPGVRSEICVPVEIGGAGAVGVLNAESAHSLSEQQCETVRECARLLGKRLAELGTAVGTVTALAALGAAAAGIADARDLSTVAARVTQAAVAATGLATSCLWLDDDAGLRCVSAYGPLSAMFEEFSHRRVARLADLVDGLSSCYTGGGALDLAATHVEELRDRGVRALLLVPLRRAGAVVGLLAAASASTATVSSEQAQAAELLASCAALALQQSR